MMGLLLFKATLKELLRNPYAWGWGFFFITFWLVMGAYVFSLQLPPGITSEVYIGYTGSWYSMVVVFSFAALAMGLTQSAYHASFSIRYLTKYSSLTSVRYYLTNTSSSMVFFALFAALLGLETVLMYSSRFEIWLAPKRPMELAAATLLSALFMYILAALHALGVLVLRKPRMVGFVSFVPLMLSYPLLFAQLYVNIGDLIVISPFNVMNSLLLHYYTDLPVPRDAIVLGARAASFVDISHLWFSLIAWIVLLSLLNISLMGKQRGVSIEEFRQL